jgi:hypothetical protein
MPRFYFHLTSKDSRIPDESGNMCTREISLIRYCFMWATMTPKHGRLLSQTTHMKRR